MGHNSHHRLIGDPPEFFSSRENELTPTYTLICTGYCTLSKKCTQLATNIHLVHTATFYPEPALDIP